MQLELMMYVITTLSGNHSKNLRRNSMNEFTKTILIALIPSAVTAILSFFSSYFLAKRKCYEEFKKITEEHKNELEKLIL